MSAHRPFAYIRLYEWRMPNGETIPGIGIWQGDRICAHLTQEQAYNMADKLVDLAERINERETNE